MCYTVLPVTVSIKINCTAALEDLGVLYLSDFNILMVKEPRNFLIQKKHKLFVSFSVEV